MKVTDKYVFFWRESFSQWNMTPFTVDGVVYNSAEQYMMAAKARLFNDKETEKKIMAAGHPRDQQALGREVKNYDQKTWDANKEEIVYTGNYAKYSQNQSLQDKMMKYKGKTFVEASPYDAVWGIKMGENEPYIEDETRWLGQNLLGKALTKVMNTLIEENSGKP